MVYSEDPGSNKPSISGLSPYESRVTKLEELLSARGLQFAEDRNRAVQLNSLFAESPDDLKSNHVKSSANGLCATIWGGPTMPASDQNLWSGTAN